MFMLKLDSNAILSGNNEIIYSNIMMLIFLFFALAFTWFCAWRVTKKTIYKTYFCVFSFAFLIFTFVCLILRTCYSFDVNIEYSLLGSLNGYTIFCIIYLIFNKIKNL